MPSNPFVKALNRVKFASFSTGFLALSFFLCGVKESSAQKPPAQAHPAVAASMAQEPALILDDALIAKLAILKFSDDEIISRIQANDTDFVLSKENLEHLKRDGVSPRILMAMFAAFNEKKQNEQKALFNEIYGNGTVSAPPSAPEPKPPLSPITASEAALASSTVPRPEPAPETASEPEPMPTPESEVVPEAPSAGGGMDALIFSSKSIDFGVQVLGTKSSVQQITITNTSVKDVEIPTPTFLRKADDPSTPAFQILNSTSCRSKLAGKESCKIDVAFAPFSFAYSENKNTPQSVLPFNAYLSLGKPAANILAKQAASEAALQNLLEARRQYSSDQRRCQIVLALYFKLNNPDESQRRDHDKCVDLHDPVPAATTAYRNSQSDFLDAIRGAKDVVTLSGTPKRWTYPITNFVVGLDASAASSQDVRQAYFVEADITAPLPIFVRDEDPLDRRFWVFLNPRITSLPVQNSTTAVTSLNVNADFLKGFPTTVSGIAQGFVFNSGIEWACPYLCRKPREGASWISDFNGSTVRARFSDSLVLGFGASTPFSQDNAPPPAFQVNPSILNAFGCPIPNATPAPPALEIKALQGPNCANITSSKDALGTTIPATHPNISFAYPDRSTFFPKFYMGLRLKTFFFNPDVHGDCRNSDGVGKPSANCEMPFNVFPGTVDLTAGKDAIVTGGSLSKWLFRIDVNHPLPFLPGMYMFGSTYLGLGKPLQTLPITLNSAANATDSNTERVILARPNRDVYRLGLGVDLLQILTKVGKPGASNAQPPPTTPAADKAAAAAKNN